MSRIIFYILGALLVLNLIRTLIRMYHDPDAGCEKCMGKGL